MPELTCCDLCGCSESKVLYNPSHGYETEDLTLYYSPKRSRQSHPAILKCQRCGLVRSAFADEPRSPTCLDAMNSPLRGSKEIENRMETFERWIKPVAPKAVLGGKLLDINCGEGWFIGEAMGLGWQAVGLEPGPQTAASAKQLAPWAEIFVCGVDTAIFPAHSFRYITCWSGFESLDSPRLTLQRMIPWLETGGSLLLNLPDIESFQARWMRSAWPELQRETCWYFSPETIRRFLSEAGFEQIKTTSAPVFTTLRRAYHIMVLSDGPVGLLGKLGTCLGLLYPLPYWHNPGRMLVSARLKN